MYCRECGHQVKENAEYCLHCGVRPNNSDNYCQSCGLETKSNQDLCVECGTLLKRQNGVAASGEDSMYAGFWRRFVAILVDGFIITIPILIITSILVFNELNTAYNNGYYTEPSNSITGWGYLLGLAINIIYFAGMHASKWQATIGKKMMGIKVTDMNGNRISFLRAVGRLFGTYVSTIILYIGFIMAGLTEKKQALHDMIASTLVMKK